MSVKFEYSEVLLELYPIPFLKMRTSFALFYSIFNCIEIYCSMTIMERT